MAHPAHKDGFFYDGHTFYVELDGKHRHPRRDASSLHALVTYVPPTGPLLTKKGQVAKRQPPPFKDEPAHFYTAQMHHYGLPPMKTRDVAKKRLLAAFNGGKTLIVPEHILQLEKDLVSEFDAAKQNLNDEYNSKVAKYAERMNRVPAPPSPGPNDLSGNFGDAEDVVDAQEQPLVVADGTELRYALERLVHRDLIKIILHVANDPETYGVIMEQVQQLQAPDQTMKPRTKLTAKKTGTITVSAVWRCIGASTDAAHPPRTKSTAKKTVPVVSHAPPLPSTSTPNADRPPRTKSTANKSAPPKQAPQPAIQPPSNRPFQAIGVYRVDVPNIHERWPDFVDIEEGMRLKVRPSSTGAHLWGSFDFGILTGVFKTVVRAPIDVGLSGKLHWRGRENEGEMWLNDDQKGYIKFLAGGRVKGCLEGFMAKAEFTGELVEADVDLQQIQKWKEEWRGMNEAAYEAERVGRWGSWTGDPRPDKPSASDTSDEEGGSGDELHDSEDEHDIEDVAFYS